MNGCPLEVGIKYQQDNNSPGGMQAPEFYVCFHNVSGSCDFWVHTSIDSTWTTKYIKTDNNGAQWYYVEMGQIPGQSGWSAWIYNWSTRTWDCIASTPLGSGYNFGYGWDMWETHFYMNWEPSIVQLESISMEINNNGIGIPTSSATSAAQMNSYNISQDFTTNMISNYWDWSVI